MITRNPAAVIREIFERYRLKAASTPRDLLLPEDATDFLRSEVVAVHPPGEYLGAIFVDDVMRALATNVPYLGYLRRLEVAPRPFMAPGVVLGASGLLLFHHCPGQEPRPRRHDVRVAKLMIKAGDATGIPLLDYLVLGQGAWISLQESGRVRFSPLDPEPAPDRRAAVKPKYRDPERPSRTWSGRGKMALWLRKKLDAGARLEDFEVAG